MDAIRQKSTDPEKRLLLLCWLVYVCSTFGKYSYTANKISVIAHFGVSNAQAGLIGTVFFIAYGIGQVVHGIFCRHYPQKYIVTGCLAVTGAINLLFSFDLPFGILKYLWLVNGIVEAVIWPCMVLTISRYLSKKALEGAVVVMSTTATVGIVIAYSFAALFAAVGGYHLSFRVTGVLLCVMAGVWFFSYDSATAMPCVLKEETKAEEKNAGKLPLVFLVEIITLGCFAVFCNFIKDGLSSWTSVLLRQSFEMTDSAAILFTVGLSIVAIFGAYAAMLVHRKVSDFVLLSVLFFGAAALLFLGAVVCYGQGLVLCLVLLLGAIMLCASAVNNVITSMAPLILRERVNAGLLSGILNGACYIGSSISDYGLGAFSDAYDWSAVLWLMLGVCLAPFVLGGAMQAWKSSARKNIQ